MSVVSKGDGSLVWPYTALYAEGIHSNSCLRRKWRRGTTAAQLSAPAARLSCCCGPPSFAQHDGLSHSKLKPQMLTGCTMFGRFLMYLAKGRPGLDPVVENLVGMHTQDATVTVCPKDCGGCHDRFNLSSQHAGSSKGWPRHNR